MWITPLRRVVVVALMASAALVISPLCVLFGATGPNDYNFSQCINQANCGNCLDSFVTSTTCTSGFACCLAQGSTVQFRVQSCIDAGNSGQWCQASGISTSTCNNMNLWVCSNCRDAGTGRCLDMPTTCVCSGTPTFTGGTTRPFTPCTGGS
jgi:hypothetical protein